MEKYLLVIGMALGLCLVGCGAGHRTATNADVLSGETSGAASDTSASPPADADAGVATAAPQVFDGLTKEQVLTTIMGERKTFQACFESELQKYPSLQGTIKVSWHIDSGGRVTAAEVFESTMGSHAVEQCIVAAVLRLLFPESTDGKRTDVRFPFVFQPRPE